MNNLKTIKSILVTSTRSYSDSTSMASDLAGLIARCGKHVLLVDADFHRPILHQVYNLPNKVGFYDVLTGQQHSDRVMHFLPDVNISVITSGKVPHEADGVINPKQISSFIKTQEKEFNKVIIHGPPFFYSEVVTLASLVDGVVLMIHPGYAKSETSRAIIEKFQRSGATIIGIIMRNQPRHSANQSAFIDRLLSYDKQVRTNP